jgi:predicted esterase
MAGAEFISEEQGLGIHRLPIEWSAYFAVHEPEHADNPPLILATHGYGQSAKSFMRVLEPLRAKGTLIAAAQAPNQFYWQQGRPPKIGYTWMTSYMREFTIRDNLAYMKRLWEALQAGWHFDRNRVFLLGFSQGSAMAYRLAASGILRPAGVIACGGDLPPDVEARLDRIDRFPTLIVHGTRDESMTYDKAVEGQLALELAGFDVATEYFDGGHDLPPDQIEAVWAWISTH